MVPAGLEPGGGPPRHPLWPPGEGRQSGPGGTDAADVQAAVRRGGPERLQEDESHGSGAEDVGPVKVHVHRNVRLDLRCLSSEG